MNGAKKGKNGSRCFGIQHHGQGSFAAPAPSSAPWTGAAFLVTLVGRQDAEPERNVPLCPPTAEPLRKGQGRRMTTDHDWVTNVCMRRGAARRWYVQNVCVRGLIPKESNRGVTFKASPLMSTCLCNQQPRELIREPSPDTPELLVQGEGPPPPPPRLFRESWRRFSPSVSPPCLGNSPALCSPTHPLQRPSSWGWEESQR